ncbi:tetratricopeptide repeat protein [Paracoccus sp. (in: a-proteobacteria)]|uniref:tetratricopeptide repeat protein n=1 Tax=Paracoccus sp. TaxID=267 RepID=UPI0026E074D8|nr:tetratricopeptide repeat protein [Paracoccus sp. (in: a-proteobacteria)]MDO5647692.1 tetratricopeptide repeat protein [Paracoccus sp. (in: a-proteobacteria)]
MTNRLTLTLCALLVALPATAQTQAPRAKPVQHAQLSGELPGMPVRIPRSARMLGVSGPYLAARMAAVENDYAAAARYFTQALAHDPTDPFLQDSALVALTSSGDVDRGVALASQMIQSDRGTELARLLHRASLIRAGNWDGLIAFIDANRSSDQPIDRDLMDGTMRAWALLGAGRGSDALAAFNAMAAHPDIAPVVNYHLALASAKVGDYERAAELLAVDDTGAHLLGVMARAQVLAQLDRRDEAVAVLNALPALDNEPQLLALRDRLAAGEAVSFDVIDGPADGVAQLLLAFSAALATSPDPEPLSLIHARLAVWMSPANSEARLLTAQQLLDRQQFDLADVEFNAVRDMGQVRPVAELTRIEALARGDRLEQAEQAARDLVADYPNLPQAQSAMGDVLRQREKFADAVPFYDRTLDLLADAPADARWFPLYARGIALERSGQFDRAEADFLAAIDIRPDQASLLNYLGYSWIDRNVNLDRGLDLIKQAAELSPGDGYILDSLAWAYYRLGRYQDAVAPMEEAVGQMSNDPLVNDHLGDIYWKVGRKREADIQWRRALSLKPTQSGEVNFDRIRDKLDRGLDAVLADEAGQ